MAGGAFLSEVLMTGATGLEVVSSCPLGAFAGREIVSDGTSHEIIHLNRRLGYDRGAESPWGRLHALRG